MQTADRSAASREPPAIMHVMLLLRAVLACGCIASSSRAFSIYSGCCAGASSCSLLTASLRQLGNRRLGPATRAQGRRPTGKNCRRLQIRCLNRLLVEPSELRTDPETGLPYALLAGQDPRTQHVRTVLKAANGQTLRAGVLDGGYTNDARLQWVEENQVEKMKLELGDLQGAPPLRPRVDLLLAVPRPLQLERILPVVSSLGIGTLILAGAAKVEKGYFGSHLFRKPHELRAKLVEGLEQCGDTAVPRVVVARRLKIFLEDDLEQLAPPATTLRIVAHPRALDGERESPRVHELHPPMHSVPEARRLLVAIGPEGGWQEPYELEMLKKHGFATVTLGERVLRSDVAVSVLLGLAHDWLAKNGESPS